MTTKFLPAQSGVVGARPAEWRLETTSTLSTITATGYLNQYANLYSLNPGDKVSAVYADNASGDFRISVSGGNYTMVLDSSDVVLPVTANHLAVFLNADGAIGDDVATAINGGNIQAGLPSTAGYVASFSATPASGSLRMAAVANTGDTVTTISNAAMGQATTISFPDPGAAAANVLLSRSAATQHITVSGLQVDAGAVYSGLATGGFTGTFVAYPTTSARGSFQFVAANNTGNTATIVTNAAMGQASTITVPDPGAATANFLLDAGTANLIAYQEMIPLSEVKLTGAGAANWTYTRVGQSNYALVHTVGVDETILTIDITKWVRTAASKGFRLDSLDFITFIGAAASPITHAFTLDLVNYVDNAAPNVTAIAVNQLTLPFAPQAQPYVSNRTVTGPVFDNTACSKYVVEITVSTDTTTIYSFYGLNVNFTQTIG